MGDGGAGTFRLVRRALGVAAVLAWGLVLVAYGATVVRGGSMEPTLRPGDVVVYRRGDAGLKRGDVVLFEHEGWTGGVLHRVVQLGSDGTFRTCGDANAVGDREPVRYEQVRGVAVAVIPTGRIGQAVVEALR